jgi:hypothetical protein
MIKRMAQLKLTELKKAKQAKQSEVEKEPAVKDSEPKPVSAPQTKTVPELKEVKQEEKATPVVKELKTPKKKAGFSTEQNTEYIKILADGKPHSIKSLLDHFKLDHTAAGREKLRTANRTINESGKFTVIGVQVEGGGKHFQLRNADGTEIKGE